MNNFRRRTSGQFEDYIVSSTTYVKYSSNTTNWTISPTTSACTLVSETTVKLNSDVSFTLPYTKKTTRADRYASGKTIWTTISTENKVATGKFLSGDLTFDYNNVKNGAYFINKATPSNLTNFQPPFVVRLPYQYESVYDLKIAYSDFGNPDSGWFGGIQYYIPASGNGVPSSITIENNGYISWVDREED